MSTQVRQIIFVGLAVVLIAFVIWMVRPQAAPAVANPSAGGAPVGAAPTEAVGQEVQQRLVELQEKAQQSPKDVKVLTELGNLFFDLQQFAKAADTYSAILEIDSKNADIRTSLATAYFFQGMSNSAIREYKAVIEAEPTKGEAHFNLALALSHSNPPDIEGAVKAWQEVIKLMPDSDFAKKSQAFIDAYQNQQK